MKIEGYKDYCTVGDLKKFLEEHKLPDDAKILIQRIEDFYFEENNWTPIKKEGFFHYQSGRTKQKFKLVEVPMDEPKLKLPKKLPAFK